MPRTPLFLALLLSAGPVAAIDTTFTYQGSLTDAGQPANGSYDLQFTLVDNRPVAVVPPIALEDVPVSNGVFTVVLDFGPTAFTGADRFLQIGVRPGNATRAHTLLTPNTAVRPAPYSQLAADALFAASVDDNTISTAKIVDGAVGTADLADGGVGTADLAANAVTSAKIVDGTVAAADLVPNSISSSLLAPGAVLNGNLAAGAVGTTQLMNSAVTSIKIADGAIVAADIAANTITGQSILDNTITAADIAADAITSAEIANGAIQTIDVGAGTIVGAHIASGSITDADIAGNTITGGSILNGTLTASDVAANTFWSAGGNAGTDPTTQFLGTTDGQTLQMKAAKIGVNTATPAAPFEIAPPGGSETNYGQPLARFSPSANGYVSVIRNQSGGGPAIEMGDYDYHGRLIYAKFGTDITALELHDEGGAELELETFRAAGNEHVELVFQGPPNDPAIALKPGGGPWSVLSDARLKHNVQPLVGALDHLLQLRSVTFEYNEGGKEGRFPAGVQTGFVAQQVQRVFPDWVERGSDGYLTVGSKGFESLVVQALRELRTEKDSELSSALEAIEELRHENARMRAQLDAVMSSHHGRARAR